MTKFFKNPVKYHHIWFTYTKNILLAKFQRSQLNNFTSFYMILTEVIYPFPHNVAPKGKKRKIILKYVKYNKAKIHVL